MKKIKKILLSIFLPVVMILTAGILSFASITEIAHALSGNGGGFFVGSNTTLNFNATISGSSATNGGGVYVANGGTFNMNGGAISGNTAIDGGGVYVANGGTFNMNGGSIFGNKATNNGDSIYNNGTFIMTGGTLGETNGVAWVYCDRNAVTQIYGGTVHDNFYMYSNLQTKMGTTINGKIFLAETSTITVQDYAGTTPEYNIEVSSSRQSGTIVTFKGSTVEPILSKINVTGYDSESYAVKTKKDSSGNWTISLVENSYDFPSDWKTQVASTTYMTTTVTPANLTSIKFAPTVPSGYSQIGTLSTGLPVYKGTKATEIAFVGKKIYAPENASQLFDNLSKLTTLDMSVFDTSIVTNMNNMFRNCSALKSLDLSYFNTSNVTDMGLMFCNCSALTSLDLSNFNTSNVTDMGYMFRNCSALTSLDVSGFNTSNVTDMSYMFDSCLALTSLDVSGFNTTNVTIMDSMFRYCLSLTSLDVSGFNTSIVTNMNGMFGDCSALTDLDMSVFDTSKVTNMSSMFGNCSALTSLDVSGFNTSNVTHMSYMFVGCSKLTSLDVSGLDTSKVTNMSYMFSNCSALTSLDISSFNMAKVTSSTNMLNFGTSNKILTLKTPYKNSTAIAITTGSTLYNVSTGASVTSVPANTTTSQTYATKVTLTFDANGGTCSTSSIVGYYGCSLSEIGKSLPTPTQSGYNFNGWYSPTGSRVTASTVLTFTSSTTLTARWTEITTPDPDPPTPPDPDPPTPTNSDIESAEYIVFTTRSGVPSGFSENNTFNYTRTNGNTFFETGCTPTVYTNESGTQVAFVGNGGELVAPTDCTGLFSNMVNLKWVIFRNYDTFNSTNFTSMFEDCGSLEFVDLLTFQTPNVESMACMFKNCPLLKQVAKADFDCINLASASEMFNGCTSLGTSYVYGPGNTAASYVGVLPNMKYTYNLANADLMFANSGVTGFSMSYFFTNNLSSASGMFENCNITYLDLSAWVDNYGFTSGLFDSGAAPVVVYTPRRCNPSTFMSQFTGGSYEYSLAGGESSDIFDQLGLQDFLSPISFCFVRSDKTSDYTAYTFNLDVDYCGNDDLADLIKRWGDGVSDPQSSTFYSNGQLRGIGFKTYGEYSYYVLPASFIVYSNNSSAEESELAGWIADDSFGDEGTLDGLTYGSFLSLSDIWSSGGNGAVLRSVRWRDEMISNPNYDSSADVPNAIDTPYSNWFGDQRHLHARVRYLPSVHGTQGNIFKGWGPGPNGEILGYFTNIVPISNNGDYWWTDGFSPCWEDIENIIRNDYWSFPTDSASFVSIVENSSFENSSKSDSEINLEELMEIYQKSKQHVLIPEDKKVTITELKLKKVS